ncbi:acyl-CoA thioester hydrolase YciA [Ferrimonas balearica]|uniref:acyl-CoA thioester hydrolase YciA n=1 Tax=Ferrimonas balearica TaxID=44012 RepID=UPI001C99BEDF|nr:acyl-CoA thioester hydrolase YciA [Ferrimonas balearica]MBY5992634.1 acyl-CoA thioester hydrolase YciA [Ferrimonas balearica]
MSQNTAPEGELLLRTLAMPADTNANGDIFGGWIMAQMDMAGGLMAKQISRGRICTVAVDGMSFHRPVAVGDAVCVYGRVRRLGNSSMEVELEVWARPIAKDSDAHYCVTEAVFTYVAIDEAGRPRKLPR